MIDKLYRDAAAVVQQLAELHALKEEVDRRSAAVEHELTRVNDLFTEASLPELPAHVLESEHLADGDYVVTVRKRTAGIFGSSGGPKVESLIDMAAEWFDGPATR